METFIERHGEVRYSAARELGVTLTGRCEICRSPDHAGYVLDHCHDHGWIRGILCGPCNAEMSRVDRGAVHGERHLTHWAKCPDCRELGASARVLKPLRIPRPPAPPRVPRCAHCNGNEYIWLPSVSRMARCPMCRGVHVQ